LILINERSLVIDHLRLQTNSKNVKKVGVIHFYFDNHDAGNKTAEDVIRSFLKQIVYQMDDINVPKNLTLMFEHYNLKGISEEPTRDQLLSLLGECFDEFETVYICIDAFDECAEGERSMVLQGLQRLSSRKSRLFLTGRTYLLETLKTRGDHETQIWFRDASFQEIKAATSDIEIYLNEKIRAVSNADRLEKLRPRIVDAISSQSKGQYVHNFKNGSHFI
jgi:hypothetical protein